MKRRCIILLSGCLLSGSLMAQYDVNHINRFPFQRNLAGDDLADLHVGDFNNDGNPDIVLDGDLDLNQSGFIEFSSKPVFFLGDGQGNLTPMTSTFQHPGNSAFICDVADHNNDGYDDLLVADFWANGMRLYNGGANLAFTLAQNLPTGTHGAKGHFVDIDVDGDLDIVNVSSGSSAVVGLHVFHNNAGNFIKSSYNTIIIPGVFPQEDRGFNPVMFVADLNHDALPDVFSFTTHGSIAGERMNTWIQNPNKTFNVSSELVADDMSNINNERFCYWTRDVNGDGYRDLLFFDDASAIDDTRVNVAYSEPQSPYFGTAVDLQSELIADFLGNMLQEVHIGDVDNDGTEDMVAYNRDQPSENRLVVITDPFDDNGHFQVQTLNMDTTDIEIKGHGLLLADINKDNDLELISLGLDDTLRVFDNPTLVAGIVGAKLPDWGFSVYPNPSTDFIRMEWQNEKMTSEITAVKIYDGTGRIIQSYTQGEWLKPMSVSALAAGRYLLSAETAAGSITKVFIRQ